MFPGRRGRNGAVRATADNGTSVEVAKERNEIMGIIDRISQLTRANVNDLLDRAEDPEKMLNQILRDMETNIRQAREQVASMIAQEKEIEIDLAKSRKLSSE